jgi:hypothetical protein
VIERDLKITRLLRIDDAATATGLSPEQLMRLIADGRITYAVMGERDRNALRIPDREVERIHGCADELRALVADEPTMPPLVKCLQPLMLVPVIEHGVYFLAGGDRVKIGVSNKGMPGRIENLQSSCPIRLSLVLALHGETRDEARLHARFAADRLHGEWFRFSPSIRRFVVANGGALPEDTGLDDGAGI